MTSFLSEKQRNVFTPTIETTREFSTEICKDLRYTSFSNTRTLPYIGKNKTVGQHFVPYLKNKQLRNQVITWWTKWRYDQCKLILSGFTDRLERLHYNWSQSSIHLLGAMATSLEPLFHRDFAAHRKFSLRTNMSIGITKKAIYREMDPTSEVPETSGRHTSNSDVISNPPNGDSRTHCSRLSNISAMDIANVEVIVDDEEHNEEDDIEPDPLVKFAVDMTENIIEDSIKELQQEAYEKTSLFRTMTDIDTWIPKDNNYKTNRLFNNNNELMKKQFSEQRQQIWEWMESWEEHECFALFCDLIKLCNSDLMSFLSHYIHKRLLDLMKVSWLPDRLILIIFSYLEDDDLNNCAQVCKRWRYLSEMDGLWKLKCQKIGYKYSIQNMVELIIKCNDLGIDWKGAYRSIKSILKYSALQCKHDSKQEFRMLSYKEIAKKIARQSSLIKRKHSLSRISTLSCKNFESIKTPIILEQSTLFAKSRDFFPCKMSASTRRTKTPTFAEKNEFQKFTLKRATKQKTIVDLPSKPIKPITKKTKTKTKTKIIRKQSAEILMDDTENQVKEGLTQWIRGRGHTQVDEEEVALDVRPTLSRINDLSGNFYSKHQLHWKNELEDKSESLGESMKPTKYAGIVRGIRRVRKIEGHTQSVTCIEFDKVLLFTGSNDRVIRVWDVRSGKSIQKLIGHKGGIECMKYEQPLLFSGSWDMSIIVWDIVHFSKKISGCHDKKVRIFCKESLQLTHVLKDHLSSIISLTSNDDILVSASIDRTIHIYSLDDYNLMNTIKNLQDAITNVLLIEDLLIVSGSTGLVYFCEMEKHNGYQGSIISRFQAHNQHSINALIYYCGRFYTASSDMTIKEWDLNAMTCVRTLIGHRGSINDFKVSNRRMISCSSDGDVRIWDFLLPSMSSSDQEPADFIPMKRPPQVTPASK